MPILVTLSGPRALALGAPATPAAAAVRDRLALALAALGAAS